MASPPLKACPYQPFFDAQAAEWQYHVLASEADMNRLVWEVVRAMGEKGYAERDCFAVRLSLCQAVVNAHKHGHGGNWNQLIVVRCLVSPQAVIAQVQDQGEGFTPQGVPDPRAPENLTRESGRGLFLMRQFASDVCHNGRGNCVCFCLGSRISGERGAACPHPIAK
jgi:serine/threonine-protein kinase RsbW